MPETRLVILTALKEEFAAVQAALPEAAAQGVEIVRAGVGWDAATKAAHTALQKKPRSLCFSGFCGGLVDALAVGDIVFAQTVCCANETIDMAEQIRTIELSLLKIHRGKLLTVREPVLDCARKREFGQQHNAIAVDMETFAVAQAARAAGVPFCALRAVSDTVDDALPPEVAGFLDENGDVRAANVAKFAMKGPRNMKALWALKQRSDKARASLTLAWQALWPELQKLLNS